MKLVDPLSENRSWGDNNDWFVEPLAIVKSGNEGYQLD
jgi:hypothetical protein